MRHYRNCAYIGRFAIIISSTAMLAFNALPVWADGTETREFVIRIKNKPAGHYQMTITAQADTTTMTGQAQVNFRQFGFRYSYRFSGTETWQNGRLTSLNSSCNDDGKQYTVSAQAESNGLRVQANGLVRNTRADVWTTTYWSLVDPKFRNQNVPLIDADTGRDLAGYLAFVSRESVSIAGQQQTCSHYKLTGANLQVDLWYDSQDRLVRELTIEQGQPTLLELQRIEHQ